MASKQVLTVFRRGQSIFPEDIDLELVDGMLRPSERVQIDPEDTFILITRYEPKLVRRGDALTYPDEPGGSTDG